MKVVKNERFGLERALYNSKNLTVEDCKFEGPEDGESALKECNNSMKYLSNVISEVIK